MPPPGLSEIVTTTMRGRSRMIADNVTKNNALLSVLSRRGKVKPFSGGYDITQELSYAENATYKRYSGAEALNINQSQVLTAATFALKQSAVAVIITGLEQLQNMGRERMLDLLDERITVAENTMKNNLSADVYSDGSADGGKQMNGLDLLVSKSPNTGTVGGISRVTNAFWRHQYDNIGINVGNVEGRMRAMWLNLTRGRDMPDLFVAGNTAYEHYWASLTEDRRFTQQGEMAKAGWNSLKFRSADVVLDGGQGGNAPDNGMYVLNCDYLFYRPHRSRNMVPLDKRVPVDQDAEITLLAWCGNMATNNLSLQGRIGQD